MHNSVIQNGNVVDGNLVGGSANYSNSTQSVEIDGKIIVENLPNEIKITIIGKADNVKVTGNCVFNGDCGTLKVENNATISGNVTGNVKAGNDLVCGAIKGNAKAGNNLVSKG